MRSDRFYFGSASTDSTTSQPLFTAGGIEVTTFASSGTTFVVRVVNRTSDEWEFGSDAEGAVSPVGPGSNTTFTQAQARAMLIIGRDTADPTKAISIQCGSDFSPNLLECFAQISPGA
jgi:hypothetical protein